MLKQTCAWTAEIFTLQQEDLALLARLSPVIGDRRYKIPPPRLCPEARQQRRIAFRNDQNYYHTNCALSGKKLISIYSPDKPFPVLATDVFWSNDFDPLSYGQKYDFNRSFFEQFAELKSRVPRLAVFHTQSENADYSVHSSRNKNCYFVSSTIDCEDLLYCDLCFSSKDCMDLFSCQNMELCYQCLHCKDCFNSDYLEHCYNLSDSYLCFDCRSSENLLGCVLLRQRRNMILNQEASAEECNATKQKLKSDPVFRKDFLDKFKVLQQSLPRPPFWAVNTENSQGNYLVNCKDIFGGFDLKEVEDARYANEAVRLLSAMDVTRAGDPGELLYEITAAIDLKYSAFCNLCYQSSNLLYCDNCQGGTNNCFGSMSLKKHQYCILNKQYSKTEYYQLLPKIIAHMHATKEWGEFFPVELSPFGYNETKAQDWFPLSKEQVLQRGWQWSDYENPEHKDLKVVDPSKLTSSIEEIPADICKQAIYCKGSKKVFRLATQELKFYQKKNLPIPQFSPKERHRERSTRSILRKFYQQPCAKTGKKITTVYPPSSGEIIYCEEEYLRAAY